MPSLAQWIKGSSLATAVAQIRSLAWEFPYVSGVAIKKKKSLGVPIMVQQKRIRLRTMRFRV